MKQNFPILDQWRGIVVLCMILFHFLYDLEVFGIYTFSELFMESFSTMIGASFIMIHGLVSKIQSQNLTEIEYRKKIFRQGLKLGFFALLITAMTLLFFSKNPIYFGILHLMSLLCFLSPLLVRLPSTKNTLLISMVLISVGVWMESYYPQKPLFLLFTKTTLTSMADHYPLLPWSGYFLMGVFLFEYGKKFYIRKPTKFFWLEKIGKNSLWIYLIHQPVMIGLIFFFLKLTE